MADVSTGTPVGASDWGSDFFGTLDEMARVTFNSIFRRAVYGYDVSSNLARHFHAAGLSDVRTEAFLSHTDNLDAHPFWRAFIVHQMPMFVHAGLIEEAPAQALLTDLEALNARHEFSASFIVQAAVGMKAATV